MKNAIIFCFLAITMSVSVIGCSTASTSVKYDGNKSFAVEKKKITKPKTTVTIRKIDKACRIDKECE